MRRERSRSAATRSSCSFSSRERRCERYCERHGLCAFGGGGRVGGDSSRWIPKGGTFRLSSNAPAPAPRAANPMATTSSVDTATSHGGQRRADEANYAAATGSRRVLYTYICPLRTLPAHRPAHATISSAACAASRAWDACGARLTPSPCGGRGGPHGGWGRRALAPRPPRRCGRVRR